jgi:hypothetical protein
VRQQPEAVAVLENKRSLILKEVSAMAEKIEKLAYLISKTDMVQ